MVEASWSSTGSRTAMRVNRMTPGGNGLPAAATPARCPPDGGAPAGCPASSGLAGAGRSSGLGGPGGLAAAGSPRARGAGGGGGSRLLGGQGVGGRAGRELHDPPFDRRREVELVLAAAEPAPQHR